METLHEIDIQLFTLLNGSNSSFVDGIMMMVTNGITWIPLYIALFFLVIKNNESMLQIAIIVGCALGCVLVSTLLADFISKPLFARWRPSSDPLLKYAVDVVDNYRPGKYGFFSAHAANTFSLALFISLWVRNRLFTLTMVIWSLLNCYSRIYLGAHYPSDILVGLLAGAAVGIAFYFLCKNLFFKITPRLNYVSTRFSSTGYSIADIDMVMTVISLLMIAIILIPLF